MTYFVISVVVMCASLTICAPMLPLVYFFLYSPVRSSPVLTQMMLVDAGRAQEALELDAALLGYLRDDAKGAGHDVLEGTTEDMLVSASK